MNKFTKIFIAIASVLVIGGTIVLAIFGPRESGNIESRNPNIDISASPYIPDVKQRITPKVPKQVLTNELRQKITAQLPYVGNGFVVEYLPTAQKFYVRMGVPTKDSEEYRAALMWLKNVGIADPEDTSDIQFTFPIIKK
ncbi:MAG: hypothetical protein WC775_04795 [Patescibacteria group bacterium]|jgi:hypothetical protein